MCRSESYGERVRRPVAIHARSRTLAPRAAPLEDPRGGYLGSISRAEVRPRPVSARSRTEAAARTVAGWPATPAESAGGRRTERRRAARARSGGADDDAAVRIDADRLGLHTGGVLHREVHDPPLVGEHRLERHGLAARAHAFRDTASDLAELLFAAAAIALDVERDMDRPPDAARCDRGRDLLQGDEVLAAPPDEGAEIRAQHFDAFGPWAVVE